MFTHDEVLDESPHATMDELLDESVPSRVPTPSTPSETSPPPARAQRKKSRGAKRSKSEREERRAQREAAARGDLGAASEDITSADFKERLTRLQQYIECSAWNEAIRLGGESVQLADALISGLQPLGRHKVIAHIVHNQAKRLNSY